MCCTELVSCTGWSPRTVHNNNNQVLLTFAFPNCHNPATLQEHGCRLDLLGNWNKNPSKYGRLVPGAFHYKNCMGTNFSKNSPASRFKAKGLTFGFLLITYGIKTLTSKNKTIHYKSVIQGKGVVISPCPLLFHIENKPAFRGL